jgi:mono/diheme cytochrome c family protein
MIVLLFSATACSEDRRQARGFSLPEGDVQKGQQVFTEMRCNDCHQVGDFTQASENQTPEFNIELGGKVQSIKTYGDLVTSIINPSHRIARVLPLTEVTTTDGESRMRNYNDIMTVQELVDLVTFLQSEYELQTYYETKYRHYYPHR